MSFDDGLAERLREILWSQPDIAEKRMFGGFVFMRRDCMFVGTPDHALMARVGPVYCETASSRAHAQVMDFTGKPMKGYVFVDTPGFDSDGDLAEWVRKCLRFVRTLPPKKPKSGQRLQRR